MANKPMTIGKIKPMTIGEIMADPIQMAGLTVRAVEQIGSAASAEIDKAAQELLAEAQKVADNLHDLAEAIREHSRIAGEHVAAYCAHSTNVLETVRKLQEGLKTNREGENGSKPHNSRTDS
jgi:methyl-accepting chemotaxis protein